MYGRCKTQLFGNFHKSSGINLKYQVFDKAKEDFPRPIFYAVAGRLLEREAPTSISGGN